MTAKDELLDLEKGGAWKEEDYDTSLDWKGEKGSQEAAEGAHQTIEPKTHKEQEESILADAGISPEVLSVISSRLARTNKKIASNQHESVQQLLSTMDERLEKNARDVEEWKNSVNEAAKSTPPVDENTLSRLTKLDERISSMEYKIETMIASMTKHGAEEARVIHEAHKIITERRDRELAEDDTYSEPSVFQRLEKVSQENTERLRALEPAAMVEPPSTARPPVRSIVRKKFGKMI